MNEHELKQLRFTDADARKAIVEIRRWGTERRLELIEWSASRAELDRIPTRPTCPAGRVSLYLQALHRHNELGEPKPELTWDETNSALILTCPNTDANTEETAA